MTPDPRDLLTHFEAELSEAESQLSRLQQRAQSLRTTVEGLRGLASLSTQPTQSATLPIPPPERVITHHHHAGITATALEPPYMKPREAWLWLMREQPREWSVKEVGEEMERRGWLDPKVTSPVEAVRAAGRRLTEVEGLLQRVGVSSFIPKGNGQPAGSFAIGAAVGTAVAALAQGA
jgi:hypothetical protein